MNSAPVKQRYAHAPALGAVASPKWSAGPAAPLATLRMPLPQMYPAPAPAPSTNFNTLQLDMLQKYACIRQERSSNKEPEQQAAEKEAAVPKALPSELAHAPHAHSAAAAQPPPPLFAHWPSQIFAGGAVQVAHVHNPVQMVHMQVRRRPLTLPDTFVRPGCLQRSGTRCCLHAARCSILLRALC